MRVGIGYDIHTLRKGRKFILGGITIPHNTGLWGHSDGDVLLHAIIDAALGAAGLGDIGDYFSDSDPRWKDADSSCFAAETVRLLVSKGFRIAQIDSVVIAQEPKLAAHRARIRESVARQFGVSAADVNVKAKTNEGMDAVGKKRAVACHAVVLLKRRK